jgi:hypothetical protein
LNAVHETLLLLLVIIVGTIVATVSHYWPPSFWTSFVMVVAPTPVGFACGRITSHVVVLVGRAARASANRHELGAIVETTARRLIEEIKVANMEEVSDGDQEAHDIYLGGKFGGVSSLWHELERVLAVKARP